jgi:hypothetical protein
MGYSYLISGVPVDTTHCLVWDDECGEITIAGTRQDRRAVRTPVLADNFPWVNKGVIVVRACSFGVHAHSISSLLVSTRLPVIPAVVWWKALLTL